MSELVPLLGTLAVLLTLIGSYRSFSFFFTNDPIFAGLFAVAVTVSFLVILDVLLLALGILALTGPVAALAYYSESLPLPSNLRLNSILRKGENTMFQDYRTNGGAGKIECRSCGDQNGLHNRHCENCGELL